MSFLKRHLIRIAFTVIIVAGLIAIWLAGW
jgi:hypothetical protein